MKHLFSPEGDAALAATMALQPLLAFDFDGTLAPIVARPEEARVSIAVSWRLDQLARRLPLAIVSGRSVDDVRARLSFTPGFIVGNHGAEDPLAAPSTSAPAALDGIRARMHPQLHLLDAAGVTVEDKYHSIALHYRLARDRVLALGVIERLLDSPGPGVHVFGGKQVVNIVAANAPDKADAVARLAQRCGARSVIFIGDDINDEPVFARAEPSWLTVRVGRDDPTSQARFCLESSGEVASMLDRMLGLQGMALT